jgi:hypothetical protein
VAQQVTVTGTCTPEVYDETTTQFYTLAELSKTRPPAGDTVEDAYQVTLHNTGSATVQINQLAVIFYNSGDGHEIGSDQENATGLIAPHQSLSWQEILSTAPFNVGTSGGTDTRVNCKYVQT